MTRKHFILLLVCAFFIFTVYSLSNTFVYNRASLVDLQKNSTTIIGNWKVVAVVENDVELVTNESNATMTFSKDGTCSASGGCNEVLNCHYETLSDNNISISIVATEKYCPSGVVEFGDLAYFTKFTRKNNSLSLFYEKWQGVNGHFELTLLTQ